MRCSRDVYRALRVTDDIRIAGPGVDIVAHFPEGTAEPHQPEDYRGILWTKADEEGKRRSGAGWEAG